MIISLLILFDKLNQLNTHISIAKPILMYRLNQIIMAGRIDSNYYRDLGKAQCRIKCDSIGFILIFLVAMVLVSMSAKFELILLAALLFSPYLLIGILGINVAKNENLSRVSSYKRLLKVSIIIALVLLVFGLLLSGYFFYSYKTYKCAHQDEEFNDCDLDEVVLLILLILSIIIVVIEIVTVFLCYLSIKHLKTLENILISRFNINQVQQPLLISNIGIPGQGTSMSNINNQDGLNYSGHN